MKIYHYKNGKCNICGENIRHFRESRGMSQEHLASALQLIGLDLTQKAISRIETGDRVVPDYELLYFCKVFSTTLKTLLGDSSIDI